MRKLLLLSALCMATTLVTSAPVMAQSASASAAPEEYGAVTARGADTAPLNPDGTCPEGYVTVNAPFCAEESPNTPGRIFGYGEGDLASASVSASAGASASASATATASATALPETGGPNPAAFALPSLALLVAGGIFAARVVRK